MVSDYMSRKNVWKETIYEALKECALLTSEMPDLISHYRNTPSVVQIASVLSRDERFKRLDKPYCYGLSGRKSHKVLLFGRADTEYESTHPYNSKK